MVDQKNNNALLEVSQGLRLEDDLNLAASGDIDSLNGILTVSREQSGFASEFLG